MVTKRSAIGWLARGSIRKSGLVAAFWLLIAFVTITYGAVFPSALSGATLGAFILLPTSAMVFGIPPTARILAAVTTAILCVTVVWAIAQIALGPVAPAAVEAWQDASRFLSDPVRRAISVTPGDALAGLGNVALPIAVFLCGVILFPSDESGLRAIRILAIGGGMIAVASIAQFFATPEILMFGDPKHYVGSLTGTFVNRNTAATFFGLASILLAALFWRTVEPMRRMRLWMWLEGKGSGRETRQTRNAVLYGLLLLAALTALFLTRSRAGVASTFVGLAVFVLLNAFGPAAPAPDGQQTDAQSGRRIRKRAAVLGVLMLTLSGFVALSGQVLLRTQVRRIQDDDRFCIMPGIWRGIVDAWPTGAGLTSFRDWYPAYRDPACSINAVFDKAHNFYLEGLLSLGVIFVPLCLGAIATLALCFVIGIRQRKGYRFAGIIGLASLSLVLAHGLFDFSLQVPGLAVYFAAIAGPIAGICLRPPVTKRPNRQTDPLKPGTGTSFDEKLSIH